MDVISSFICPNCAASHNTPHSGPLRARHRIHFFWAYCSVECRYAYEVREALSINRSRCDECGYRGIKEIGFLDLKECGKVSGHHCSRACWERALGKLRASRQGVVT